MYVSIIDFGSKSKGLTCSWVDTRSPLCRDPFTAPIILMIHREKVFPTQGVASVLIELLVARRHLNRLMTLCLELFPVALNIACVT